MAKQKSNKQMLADLEKSHGKQWNATAGQGAKISGGIDLPKDVNGIAQYTGYKMGYVEEGPLAGKPRITIKAAVVTPKEYKGAYCGKTHTIFDSDRGYGDRPPETAADKLEKCQNDMKLVGINTDGAKVSDIEALLNAHTKSGAHFRFRTFEFNDRVYIQFKGPTEYSPEVERDVEDAAEADSDGVVEDGDDSDTEEATEESVDNDAPEERLSWTDHGEFADDNDDSDSIEALTTEAKKHNIDPEEEDGEGNPVYATWADVAKAIISAENAATKKKPARRKKKKAVAK